MRGRLRQVKVATGVRANVSETSKVVRVDHERRGVVAKPQIQLPQAEQPDGTVVARNYRHARASDLGEENLLPFLPILPLLPYSRFG